VTPLHDLRLNCILAPLSVALAGLIALAVAWAWHRHEHGELLAAQQREQIAGLARLDQEGAAPPLSAWLAAHPGWSGVARLRLDGDELQALDAAGAAPPREPVPELVAAFSGAVAWRNDQGAWAAAPSLTSERPAAVIAAWRAEAATAAIGPWMALGGGVLLLGGGLGLYLAARVWRPVAWFQQAAAEAAQGRGVSGSMPGGEETESLRSSLASLIAARPRGADDA
jgi:hypothetical protein